MRRGDPPPDPSRCIPRSRGTPVDPVGRRSGHYIDFCYTCCLCWRHHRDEKAKQVNPIRLATPPRANRPYDRRQLFKKHRFAPCLHSANRCNLVCRMSRLNNHSDFIEEYTTRPQEIARWPEVWRISKRSVAEAAAICPPYSDGLIGELDAKSADRNTILQDLGDFRLIQKMLRTLGAIVILLFLFSTTNVTASSCSVESEDGSERCSISCSVGSAAKCEQSPTVATCYCEAKDN